MCVLFKLSLVQRGKLLRTTTTLDAWRGVVKSSWTNEQAGVSRERGYGGDSLGDISHIKLSPCCAVWQPRLHVAYPPKAKDGFVAKVPRKVGWTPHGTSHGTPNKQ